MGIVANSALVSAAPERVIAFLTDPAEVVELSPDVEAFELDSPLAIGTRVREVRRLLGRRVELNWTVSDYVPNRRIVFDWSGTYVRVAGAVTLEPVGQGTRISTHNDIRARGAYRLITHLIERAVRREERTLFKRLQARLR